MTTLLYRTVSPQPRWRLVTASLSLGLVVDFPEPLDRAVLVRALGVEKSRQETRWSFTPARPWRSGTHFLVALAILEDLAGNQIGKPFEVDLFERIHTPTTSGNVPYSVFSVGGETEGILPVTAT